MIRRIKLRKREQERISYLHGGYGCRVVVEAFDPVDMDADIFVHRHDLLDPKDPEVISETFITVASPDDFTTYPADSPDPSQDPPYYRKSDLDVILPTRRDAVIFWDELQDVVRTMVQALNDADTLGQEEIVEIS